MSITSKVTLTLVFILGAALALTLPQVYRLKKENRRLAANQALLLNGGRIQQLRTTDGRNAAAVEALTLKTAELARSGDSLLNVAHTLGLKNRRLQALARAASISHTPIRTIVRDSVIIQAPGRTDTLPCLSYTDPWLTFSGCLRADSFAGHIRSADTLDIVVHRVPRRFLFFRWGTKAVQMHVVNRNPHASVSYLKYIRLEK